MGVPSTPRMLVPSREIMVEDSVSAEVSRGTLGVWFVTLTVSESSHCRFCR